MARLTPEQRLLRATHAPLVGAVVAYVDDRSHTYRIGRVTDVAAHVATGDVFLTLADMPTPPAYLSAERVATTWTVEWSMSNFNMTIVPALSEVPR